MIPIPEIPKGHGRAILGFSNKHAFDACVKTFKLDKDEDIDAFLLRMNIGGNLYHMIRVERKMVPRSVADDNGYLLVPSLWRQNARFVYIEDANGVLVESKHSCDCDPAETVKVLNALITLNMPIFKGRMGLSHTNPTEA